MSEAQPPIVRHSLLGILLIATALGFVVELDLAGAEILGLALLAIAGLRVAARQESSPALALLDLLVVCALASMIVTRAAFDELRSFGLEHATGSTSVAASAIVLAPFAGGMLLLGLEHKLKAHDLGRTLLVAASFAIATFTLALVVGGLAGLGLAAWKSDAASMRSQLAAIELAAIAWRAALALLVGGAVVVVGVRLGPRTTRPSIAWLAMLATAAAIFVFAIAP